MLNGKKVVITGKFDMKRNEIVKRLEAKGAKVLSSISKNADILLVGEKPGSKLDNAYSMGIQVIDDVSEISRLLA